MSKSDSNLEATNIAKKEDDDRLAPPAEVPGTEEFEESGKTRPVKIQNTRPRKGAADLKAAPLPPAPLPNRVL